MSEEGLIHFRDGRLGLPETQGSQFRPVRVLLLCRSRRRQKLVQREHVEGQESVPSFPPGPSLSKLRDKANGYNSGIIGPLTNIISSHFGS